LKALMDVLEKRPDEQLHQSSQPFWNQGFVGGLVLFFMLLEWSLRRKWSLP
jgi:hypothetical protein